MPVDPQSERDARPVKGGALRRFWAWIEALETAMDTTYDDIQDRRILALEQEVARLRSMLELSTKHVPSSAEQLEISAA